MNYIESYKFVFRSANWMVNLLLCAVAMLVPIVGPLVVLGYQFEIIEALHRRRDSPYPDFDFNKLGQYLMRGLWPFLVQLVVSLPFAAVIMVFMFVFWLVIALAASSTSGALSALIVLVLGFFALVVVLILELGLLMVLVPITLRSGLMANFGAGFSMPFIRDFIGRMWKTTLVTQLFFLLSGMVVALIGELLCFVGLYPAIALLQFAQHNLMYQLYEEYLRRGGEEIPLPAAPVPTLASDYDNDEDKERPENETGYSRRPR